MGYTTFEEFPVWQESVAFAADVIRLCNIPELAREYKLRGQLMSAAISIASNIAEGFEYNNNRQFSRYLFYAKGSASQVLTQLSILYSADMIDTKTYGGFKTRAYGLARKIGGLIQYLARSGHPGFRFPEKERELR